jgi:hypothetical protein
MYQSRDLDGLESHVEGEVQASASTGISKGKLFIGVLVGAIVAFFAVTNGVASGQTRAIPTDLLTSKTVSTTLPYDGVFSIYKHTTSVPAGSYMVASKFFSTYISAPVVTYDLGCNETWKAVGRLTAPEPSGSYASYIGFDEGAYVYVLRRFGFAFNAVLLFYSSLRGFLCLSQ